MLSKSHKNSEKNISFFFEKISFSIPSELRIRNWLSKTFLNEGFKVGQVNFIFCSDRFLLDLNKKFLKHKTLTDILTFDYTDLKSTTRISGEIFISVPRVKENARTFEVSFDEEIKRVMVHGVLHLCGYRDKTQKEKILMRNKENEYLEKIS